MSNVGFHQREHDLLSFMSLFVATHQQLDTSLTLLSVLLDNASIDVEIRSKHGGYFSVYLAKSSDILGARFLNTPKDDTSKDTLLPEVVALKIARPDKDLNSPRSCKLWSSMAMELQILRNDFLRNHDNVVTLFGICWKSVHDNTLMPAFVLEAAEADLEGFMSTPRDISYRKILGLAIDITSGVHALHEVGIIHGDIKPENVLIFKNTKLGYVAKIADFGSSLLVTDITSPIRLPFGSGFWQAPECQKSVDGQQLMKADVYSLGLVLWKLLSGKLMKIALELRKGAMDLETFFDTQKQETKAPALAYYCLKAVYRILEPETEDQKETVLGNSASEHNYMSLKVITKEMAEVVMSALFPADTRCNATELLQNLRIVLNHYLYRERVKPILEGNFDISLSPDFNPQESDISLQPDLGKPSGEDTERIWRHGKSLAWLDENLRNIGKSRPLIRSFEDISREAATGHVSETLKRWQKQREPKPDHALTLRSGEAVLEADASLGTLRWLPPRIQLALISELKKVALNPGELTSRRKNAAWQYALFHIRTLKIDPKAELLLDDALALMLQSATLGHIEAKSIVGHLYEVFGRRLPESLANSELQWLHDGICHGSVTAKRRLLSLSPDLFREAIGQLRCRFAGIGVEIPEQYFNRKAWPDSYFYEGLRDELVTSAKPGTVLLLCATANRLQLLKKITAKKLVDVNYLNEWGESPLLWACRSGHLEAAVHLLDCGADPSLASHEGVIPLHFLSAFNDEAIPVIGGRLKDRYSIEARSTAGVRFRTGLDSMFGLVDGTPLAWAVAANNETATKALINWGADPFDTPGLEVPYSNCFGSYHVSPVWYAAFHHQYDLLRILLRKVDRSKTKEFLNSYKRSFGSETNITDTVSILGYCVGYATGDIGRRFLLHGKEYRLAFQKTFETIVEYGADSREILDAAVQFGQPFVIEYLLSPLSGLKPSPSQWMHSLLIAGACQDWIMFKTLLRSFPLDIVDPKEWKKYFATIEGLPDDVQYLKPLQKYKDESMDYHSHFTKALMAGKFNIARWFYDTGICDLSRQIQDTKSVIGMLLVRAKSYSNAHLQLEYLLKLQNLPDSIFYNVAELQGSKFTALHQAVYFPEYRSNSNMANAVLRQIVEKWYEPKFLNARVAQGDFKGKTALHIAALTANTAAVRYLLDNESDSLDLSLLDGNGYSILDTAAWGLRSQESRMNFWEVPKEMHRSVDLDHWKKVTEIIVRLQKFKAKPHKISMAVTRTEEEMIYIFDLKHVRSIAIPFKFFGSKFPPELKGNAFWEEVSKLQIDRTFFLAMAENMTLEEKEARTLVPLAAPIF